jgi:hypothetical protein
MTKTLEQIQQENRKFILEAIHDCSYKEALEKELGFNCEVIARVWHHPQRHTIDNLICYFDGNYLRFKELVGDISRRDLTETGLEKLEDYESTRHRIIEIIGKPITLSRVLSAINAKGGFYDPIRLDDESNTLNFDYQGLSFNLDVETLEEQSEETQRFLNKFFND